MTHCIDIQFTNDFSATHIPGFGASHGVMNLCPVETDGVITWKCGSNPQANYVIPNSYLPSNCQDVIP